MIPRPVPRFAIGILHSDLENPNSKRFRMLIIEQLTDWLTDWLHAWESCLQKVIKSE